MLLKLFWAPASSRQSGPSDLKKPNPPQLTNLAGGTSGENRVYCIILSKGFFMAGSVFVPYF